MQNLLRQNVLSNSRVRQLRYHSHVLRNYFNFTVCSVHKQVHTKFWCDSSKGSKTVKASDGRTNKVLLQVFIFLVDLRTEISVVAAEVLKPRESR